VTEAAVAAGHPATADAGAEILADGGSAADAAVAACLASCVAETVMTGLLGGGHVLHRSAAGIVEHLDCFVAVPSGAGDPMEELQVPFGEELVHYAIGASSCAVPGVPAGLDALWRRYGRLPWPRLLEPALRLARGGVPMPPAHVACLEMLEPVMTMREGARMYAPGGSLLRDGGLLRQPGLVAALEALRDEGAASVYTGSIAETLLALVRDRGGVVTRDDLRAYEALWRPAQARPFAGRSVVTRDGSEIQTMLGRLGEARGPDALLRAFEGPASSAGHTTNLTVVDADGNACVVTTSLGLGSGDWLPGLDLHLNSMLGERDLITAPLVPFERMSSMMSPTLVVDGDGRLELALGAAGGTRLRTALVGVLDGVLREGLDPQAAVDRPRFHPAGALVNAEPGVDEAFLLRLERRGREVRRWPALHHYFGGVSAIGRAGAGADPRRSGAVARPT
jgi:gamma-glutamyltranspeptidase/glutathione hydrolase